MFAGASGIGAGLFSAMACFRPCCNQHWRGKRLPQHADPCSSAEFERGLIACLVPLEGSVSLEEEQSGTYWKALTKPIARSVSPFLASPQALSRTLLPDRDIYENVAA